LENLYEQAVIAMSALHLNYELNMDSDLITCASCHKCINGSHSAPASVRIAPEDIDVLRDGISFVTSLMSEFGSWLSKNRSMSRKLSDTSLFHEGMMNPLHLYQV
jgi:hypothetical protein